MVQKTMCVCEAAPEINRNYEEQKEKQNSLRDLAHQHAYQHVHVIEVPEGEERGGKFILRNNN